jgi:hypothetical protein
MLRLGLGADPAVLSRGWRRNGPAAAPRPNPEA